ncbi:UNVERIFIED_CONTAM: hypothetical protein Sradi_0334100 [Sesamum radiatum]|uniref:Uncharacterized protein n=1 Tax=Sesamum radiatum TaxID=300843 RepID=A0AAW2W7T9_SESRA
MFFADSNLVFLEMITSRFLRAMDDDNPWHNHVAAASFAGLPDMLLEVRACLLIRNLSFPSPENSKLSMGGKPAKHEKKEELQTGIDYAFHSPFTPRNPPALKPPDHYVEYMRLNGWLDLNLDDPDLAHLFK